MLSDRLSTVSMHTLGLGIGEYLLFDHEIDGCILWLWIVSASKLNVDDDLLNV